ncbi:MAG: C_GCAxxG_C_C family protein [Clostridia bacterium]|nr:C_GCAxxG_C_C family protein [Clostridia bacterium]
MTRAEKARELFKEGYACSQAVALAFADLTGVDEAALCKIMLPFGGGLGRLRLTCGAVSGMAAVAGLLFAGAENSHENKLKTYEIVRELCARFEEENGSLICAELLAGGNVKATVGGEAEKRTPEYYKKRPCGEIVFCAAQILEEYIKARETQGINA